MCEPLDNMTTINHSILATVHRGNCGWKVEADHTWSGCRLPYFSPPLPFSSHYLPQCCWTHTLSAPIALPLKSRSFLYGPGWSPAANEKLQLVWSYMSSPKRKWKSQKLERTKCTWFQILQSWREAKFSIGQLHQCNSEYNHIRVIEVAGSGNCREIVRIVAVECDNWLEAFPVVLDVLIVPCQVTCLCLSGIVRLKCVSKPQCNESKLHSVQNSLLDFQSA